MRTEASSNKINTTNNHIISNKLFIFCATFTIIIFILNFSIIHVHVTMIITLLAITELSTVKSGSDTTVFIYLFIYLFVYLHWIETHFQGVACKIPSGAIFIPVGSMAWFCQLVGDFWVLVTLQIFFQNQSS